MNLPAQLTLLLPDWSDMTVQLLSADEFFSFDAHLSKLLEVERVWA